MTQARYEFDREIWVMRLVRLSDGKSLISRTIPKPTLRNGSPGLNMGGMSRIRAELVRYALKNQIEVV